MFGDLNIGSQLTKLSATENNARKLEAIHDRITKTMRKEVNFNRDGSLPQTNCLLKRHR